MKKGIWIIVAALLSLGAIVGANALVSTTNVNTMKKELSAEEQIKIAPKAAVDSATSALKKALSQQNAPAVIAALVKQSAAQLLIDRDSLPAIIDKATALADRSGNPVEQSLLRLLTAKLYNLYLDRNYQIRWRDEIDDFSLPVESWSKNMFTEKNRYAPRTSHGPGRSLTKHTDRELPRGAFHRDRLALPPYTLRLRAERSHRNIRGNGRI